MRKVTASFGRLAIATMALAMLVALAPAAQASFTYSVTPVTTSTSFGAGSTLTVVAFNNGATSLTLAGPQNINLAQILQTTTTVSPSTDTGSISLAPLVVTINSIQPDATIVSDSFTVAGIINVLRSDKSGAASTFSLTSVTPAKLTLGTNVYTLNFPSYSPPTIQAGVSGSGSLGMFITEAPEPASVALMGIGVALLAGIGFRRKLSG